MYWVKKEKNRGSKRKTSGASPSSTQQPSKAQKKRTYKVRKQSEGIRKLNLQRVKLKEPDETYTNSEMLYLRAFGNDQTDLPRAFRKRIEKYNTETCEANSRDFFTNKVHTCLFNATEGFNAIENFLP